MPNLYALVVKHDKIYKIVNKIIQYCIDNNCHLLLICNEFDHRILELFRSVDFIKVAFVKDIDNFIKRCKIHNVLELDQFE